MKKKVMCLIFLLALIVPTISWLAVKNLVNTENREKREYAGFPELSAANYKNIPSGLEAWFNDRLPYKNQLVALNAEIKKDIRSLRISMPQKGSSLFCSFPPIKNRFIPNSCLRIWCR